MNNLHRARKKKNDEFYTMLPDVEKELSHYKDYFEGKTVFCNCDDPDNSAFVKYFETSNIKKLIVRGDEFRSPECIELLKQSDIVCTNPPFSLFREYLEQLMEYEKKFLIIGPILAITYKNIINLFKTNKIWLGNNTVKEFITPTGTQTFSSILWYTNIPNKEKEELVLTKNYYGNEANYPKYDNYDAIEVNKIVNIPNDYYGNMGVPITFMKYYNPKQFELIGGLWKKVNNILKFFRVEIKRRLNYPLIVHRS